MRRILPLASRYRHRVQIRRLEADDRPAVVALWHRVGLTRPWNDPALDIDRKLADSPWGLLVGVADVGATGAAVDDSLAEQQLIATVMVGYDGHRGSVYYLAVDPAFQGHGAGTALMDAAEALLLARGCPKVNVSVRADNAGVIGFYERRGYRLEGERHAVVLGLRMIPDGPQG